MAESTKKLLVAFDTDKPTKHSSDFLVPLFHGGNVTLWGVRSKLAHEYGLIVFTGRAVSPPDLFARLVDSGAVIKDVGGQTRLLEQFVTALKVAKIGSVYRLATGMANTESIELEKTPLKAAEPGRDIP